MNLPEFVAKINADRHEYWRQWDLGRAKRSAAVKAYAEYRHSDWAEYRVRKQSRDSGVATDINNHLGKPR